MSGSSGGSSGGTANGSSGKTSKGGTTSKAGAAKQAFGDARTAFKDSKSSGSPSKPSGGQAEDNEEEVGSVQDTAKSSGKGKQGAQKAKDTAKKGKKFIESAKNIKSLAPLVTALGAIGIALLIIFLIIGFIGFFTTLPGLAMENFKDTAKSFLGWLLGSKSIEVSDEQITDLAKYIEELGYSLEGCGFVPVDSVKRKGDKNNGEIEEIKCDVEDSNLYAYILANERTYTVNLEGKSIFGEFKRWGSRATLLLPGPWSVAGVVQIARDITNIYESSNITKLGMLVFDDIDMDDPNTKIEVDRENNKLLVKEGFFQVDQVNYDLNGWTGRYGKPIELSLALHLSTMAPDFVRNFCLDNDLQTEVHISTVKRDYDISYYFETADGTVLDKDKVNEAYEKLKTAVEVDENYAGTNWRDKRDEDVSLFTEDGQIEYPYVPIQMLDDLSTMTFTYAETSNLSSGTRDTQWISLKDSSNNPITFYDDNGNAKSFSFNVSGITVDSNGKLSKIPQFIEGDSSEFEVWFSNSQVSKASTTIDEIIKEGTGVVSFWKKDTDTDGFYVAGIGLSMNGLINKINNGTFSNSDAVAEEEELGWLMRQIDKLIADINKYTNESDGDASESLKELTNKFIAHHASNYGKWYSSSGGYYHDNFTQILESNDSASEKVEKLKKLRDDCKADYEIIQEAVMLIQNDSNEVLDDCGGISVSTLKLLHDFFNGTAEEIETYEPYIEKVTHHWYKDVYFINEDGSTDGFYDLNEDDDGATTTKKEEYKPEGLAADDETLNKLNEDGTIYVEMKGQYIEQLKQPEIKKDETWHYMVKNWLTNGYFFIYDGTIETAKEIESAKKYLSNFGYDPENPLLIDYDNTELLVNTDNETTSTNTEITVNEIEKKAKYFNEALENAPKGEGEDKIKVRLQKINFAKKSSLAAFSILESVHTEDGEYVYRDLKEFLIELGYFTEEDFELIETQVLDWIIPEYNPDEWPNKKYEKKDDEYGTYIRSKASLDAERAANGDTEDSGISISEREDMGLSVSAGGVDQIEANAADYGEEGYATVTCINGATYKDYKQGAYGYLGLQNAQYPYLYPSRSSDNFWNVGCGPTSVAIVLSAYGISGGIGKDALPYVMGEEVAVTTQGMGSYDGATRIFNEYGIGSKIYSSGGSDIYNVMDQALSEGRPIIVNVKAGYYSPGGHYIVVLGYDADKNLIISNPCGGGLYGTCGFAVSGPVKLDYFVNNCMKNYIFIPDTPPDGTTVAASVNNYLFIGDSITVGYSGVSSTTPGRFNSGMPYISKKYDNSALGSCYFEAEVSATIENWNDNYDNLIKNAYANEDVKGIVIMLGANGLDVEGMKSLLQKLKSDFSGIPIYVQQTLHFSTAWNSWSSGNDAVSRNTQIDQFNEVIKQYCSANGIKFVNTSSGLYAADGQLACTSDGVHLNQEGCQIIVQNIKAAIGGTVSTTKKKKLVGFEPGLKVITPGKGNVKNVTEDSITIEFTEENKVKGMTMKIEGFKVDDDLKDGTRATVEKGEQIGETTESDIKLLMRDSKKAIINNIEDYMQPAKKGSYDVEFSGEVSEEFLYYLGVNMEGMSIDTLDYFVGQNIGDGTVTSGPGVTNHCEKFFKELGYGQYWPMVEGGHYPKQVIIDVKMASIAYQIEQIKQKVNKELSQKEMEALIITSYQRGLGGTQKVFDAINSNDPNLQSIWEAYSGSFPGVAKRRKAEYQLYCGGDYVDCYSGRGKLVFATSTPFTDALEGKDTVTIGGD